MKIIITVFLALVIPLSAYAADDFATNNPDIDKYAFASSFISALGYFHSINRRQELKFPKKLYPHDEDNQIRRFIDNLTLDDSDLRIAKNYMVKYLKSPNALIRKTADIVILCCDQEIVLNKQQQELWRQWFALKKAHKDTPENERKFVREQVSFVYKRKEVERDLIKASIFMTKVLKSAQNPQGEGYQLAITTKQRERLLSKLDAYGKYTIDWGIKPGQTTVQASIATIREVLEDSIWLCVDEK